MAAAIFHCSHCDGKMQVVEHLAGQPVICPHCQRQLIMPFFLPSEAADEFPANFAPTVRARKPNYRRKTSSSPNVFIICGVIAIAGFGLKFIGDYISQNAGVLAGEGVEPATVNKELRHVRAALKWAHRREYIDRVPDFGGAFFRLEQRQPVTIPEEDFVQIVQALSKPELQLEHRPAAWWRVFLYLAYYLGLRRGELLGLTWGRVNLAALEIVVSAMTSKGRRDRVVPMQPELADVLRTWKAIQAADGKQAIEVLPWPFDNNRNIYNDWHAIQTAAGIPDGRHYVPKNCRSSCASELIAAGVPTVVVKDMLGHASVTTTEQYYINTKPALRSAAQARKVKVI